MLLQNLFLLQSSKSFSSSLRDLLYWFFNDASPVTVLDISKHLLRIVHKVNIKICVEQITYPRYENVGKSLKGWVEDPQPPPDV